MPYREDEEEHLGDTPRPKPAKASDSMVLRNREEWAAWRGQITERMESLRDGQDTIRDMLSRHLADCEQRFNKIGNEIAEVSKAQDNDTKVLSEEVNSVKRRMSFYMGGSAAVFGIINIGLAVWAIQATLAAAKP